MTRVILSIVIALAGFAAGWVGNGWRLGAELQSLHASHAQERADQAEAFSQRRTALAQERDALADRLHQADQIHTAQLQKARHENKTLADRLAAGTTGLRVDATCAPATSGPTQAAESGGVDPGAGAELTATARQAYSALRENISATEVTLAACQSSLAELQE